MHHLNYDATTMLLDIGFDQDLKITMNLNLNLNLMVNGLGSSAALDVHIMPVYVHSPVVPQVQHVVADYSNVEPLGD